MESLLSKWLTIFKSLAISKCPLDEAQWRGVQPLLSLPFTSAPFWINESKTRCNEMLLGTLMSLPAILKSKSLAVKFWVFNRSLTQLFALFVSLFSNIAWNSLSELVTVLDE